MTILEALKDDRYQVCVRCDNGTLQWNPIDEVWSVFDWPHRARHRRVLYSGPSESEAVKALAGEKRD